MDLWAKSILHFSLTPNVLELVDWFHKTLAWHKVSVGVTSMHNCSSLQISSLHPSTLSFFPAFLTPALSPFILYFPPSFIL